LRNSPAHTKFLPPAAHSIIDYIKFPFKRRRRLEDFLERIRPSVIANLTRVVRPDQTAELLSTTFRKLPANVTLPPCNLHIDFLGTEKFLQAFGAVVYALHNDYEAISQIIEAGADGKIGIKHSIAFGN
jgi:hypothetical protein